MSRCGSQLALGWEAVHSSCQGRASRRRTARLIAAAESLATRVGHPHALGMARMSSGAARYLEGNFRAGLEHLDQAEEILREQCTGVIWELDTTRLFGLWALFYRGQLAELGRRWDRFCARPANGATATWKPRRGRTSGPSSGWPTTTCRGRGRSRARRSAHGRSRGFTSSTSATITEASTSTCTRATPPRWERIRTTAPLLASSLLMRIQHVRNDVGQHGGRCAVAAAAASGTPGPLLREAGVRPAARARADRLGRRHGPPDPRRHGVGRWR